MLSLEKINPVRIIAFLPFISLIFMGWWNLKIFIFLNSIVFVLFLLSIFNIAKRRYFLLPKNYGYFLLSIFLSIVVFALSPIKNIIAIEYINFLSGFIIFFIALNVEDNRDDVRYFYPFIFIIVIASMYNIISGDDVVATTKNSNMLALSCILIIGFLLDEKKYYPALFLFAVFIATRSVAAMFSVLTVSFYYGFKNRNNLDLKNNKITVIIVILLISFLFYNIETKSIMDRLNWWKSAFYMFIEKPIFGWGYSSFTHLIDAFSDDLLKSVYAHNYFLESLVENGVLFCIFWFYFIFLLVKSAKGFYHYALIAAMLHSFFDFGLNTTAGWWLFMYICAKAIGRNILIFKLGDGYRKINRYIILLYSGIMTLWIFFSIRYLDIEKRNKIALELTENQKYDIAIRFLDISIKKYPSNIDLLLRKVEVLEVLLLHNKGNVSILSELSKTLESILIINPYYKKSYRKLERIYEVLGDYRSIYELNLRKRRYMPWRFKEDN
ncbi:MAG: O-antigen ligase family protein [Elusimicrobiota bacterium]